MIIFLNCLRFGVVSLLFPSLFSSLVILLLSLVLSRDEVVFLLLLSIAGSRMLKISFKPRTGSWGVILGHNASFGSVVATLILPE
jgi:hypothetical protein